MTIALAADESSPADGANCASALDMIGAGRTAGS